MKRHVVIMMVLALLAVSAPIGYFCKAEEADKLEILEARWLCDDKGRESIPMLIRGHISPEAYAKTDQIDFTFDRNCGCNWWIEQLSDQEFKNIPKHNYEFSALVWFTAPEIGELKGCVPRFFISVHAWRYKEGQRWLTKLMTSEITVEPIFYDKNAPQRKLELIINSLKISNGYLNLSVRVAKNKYLPGPAYSAWIKYEISLFEDFRFSWHNAWQIKLNAKPEEKMALDNFGVFSPLLFTYYIRFSILLLDPEGNLIPSSAYDIAQPITISSPDDIVSCFDCTIKSCR